MGTEAMYVVTTLCVIVRVTAELRWTTETLSISCCEGQDKLLMWSFSKGENDTIRQLHWYYNKTTLICYNSESTGFHVSHLYVDRVERKGITNILLKNVSSFDTGEYTLYPKLAEEEKENVQTISVTVYETPTQECKPAIKTHSKSVLSCSASPCGRARSLPEWRILGLQEPVGNESYLKVNSSWNVERVFCCPRGPIMNCHNGNHDDLCSAFSIFRSEGDMSFNEDLTALKAPTHRDTEHKDHVIITTAIIVSVLFVMVIFLVIAFIWYMRRKQKLTMRPNGTLDEEHPLELQTLPCVSASRDQEMVDRNLNQRLQIVNNVNLDADFFNGMFNSNSCLKEELHALRKENAKLQNQLHSLEYSLQFQKRQNVSDAWYERTVMVHTDTSDDGTNSSATMADYEDTISDPDSFTVSGKGFVT